MNNHNHLDPKLEIHEKRAWSGIKKGDTAALGELYDIHIEALFSYGMLHTKDKVAVMDGIHDLFLDLYKYRNNLAESVNVSFYLKKSLKRKLHAKNSTKTKWLFSEEKLITSTPTASVETEIIREEAHFEDLNWLQSAVKNLSGNQQNILFLKFNQNKGYEEIAEILNISTATARTSIYRALKTLRKQALSIFF